MLVDGCLEDVCCTVPGKVVYDVMACVLTSGRIAADGYVACMVISTSLGTAGVSASAAPTTGGYEYARRVGSTVSVGRSLSPALRPAREDC